MGYVNKDSNFFAAVMQKRDKCIAAGTHGKNTHQLGFGIYCDVCNHKLDHISQEEMEKAIKKGIENEI